MMDESQIFRKLDLILFTFSKLFYYAEFLHAEKKRLFLGQKYVIIDSKKSSIKSTINIAKPTKQFFDSTKYCVDFEQLSRMSNILF